MARMKRFPLFLLIGVSLAANLVLGAKIAVRYGEHRGREPAGAVVPHSAGSAKPESQPPADAWERLMAGGEAELADRLLAQGFPREIARTMVSVKASERLADLEAIVASARITTPYWRRHLRWTFRDESIRAAERALARERDAIVRELWRDLDGRHEGTLRMLRLYNGNLSDESLLAVDRARTIVGFQMVELHERSGRILFQDELEQLTRLKQEEFRAVADVLSPAEFAEIERRMNPTLRRICSDERTFKPTAQELSALAVLHQPFDEKYRPLTVLSSEQAEERAQARAELNRQTEAILGPDRFGAYLNAVEKEWLRASRFTLAHQLPASATEQILAIEADLGPRDSGGENMPSRRRERYRAGLLSEAKVRLGAAIGPQNFAAYRQGPGVWMRRLDPPPSAP